MSDLIQQLKHQSKMFAMSDSVALSKLWTSAADEIERLTADNKHIRKDLFFCDSQWKERFLRLTAERDELLKNQAKRDLESEARGLKNLLLDYDIAYEHNCIYQPKILERIEALTKQAEDLTNGRS